jgi:RHS repeat-associated protein
LNTSGELKQSVRYGPYGDNATAAGSLAYSTTNDPFLFQGGYHLVGGDAGAGNIPNDLYHYGERYYDPTAGRWTQSDSLSSATVYAFADDDPINESDPNGQFSVGEAWGWAEGQGKKLWHKAVKLVHWAINTQYAASHPGMRVPYTAEVATTCEVISFTTLVAPLPTGIFGKLASAAIYTNC